eukprot:scaffold56567_cov35-Tisochrysis_lutea.AAC.1
MSDGPQSHPKSDCALRTKLRCEAARRAASANDGEKARTRLFEPGLSSPASTGSSCVISAEFSGLPSWTPLRKIVQKVSTPERRSQSSGGMPDGPGLRSSESFATAKVAVKFQAASATHRYANSLKRGLQSLVRNARDSRLNINQLRRGAVSRHIQRPTAPVHAIGRGERADYRVVKARDCGSWMSRMECGRHCLSNGLRELGILKQWQGCWLPLQSGEPCGANQAENGEEEDSR